MQTDDPLSPEAFIHSMECECVLAVINERQFLVMLIYTTSGRVGRIPAIRNQRERMTALGGKLSERRRCPRRRNDASADINAQTLDQSSTTDDAGVASNSDLRVGHSVGKVARVHWLDANASQFE